MSYFLPLHTAEQLEGLEHAPIAAKEWSTIKQQDHSNIK